MSFGIYIQTWPGDYHLALALVASIRHWHREVPITLIPGVGFRRDDHPFDVPVMPDPEGFLGTLGHADRCFWSYHGPYEKFLFLDADILCTRPFPDLIQRISEQSGPFVFAHLYFQGEDWQGALENPAHPRHQEFHEWIRVALGVPKNLRAFDPDWDFQRRPPIVSGIWAGRRGDIAVDVLEELHQRESAFYRDVLGRAFDWNKGFVFYVDQGRLNYLIDKLGIPLYPSQDLAPDRWGGEALVLDLATSLRGENDHAFLHWAGTPRPSPSLFGRGRAFRWYARRWDDGVVARGFLTLPEVPGYSLWRHFYQQAGGRLDLPNRLAFTWRELRKLRRIRKQRSPA